MFWHARHISDHWFQVRIWRQARASGLYAAQCMADSVDELGSRGAFDLFVHATQFFGYQVGLSNQVCTIFGVDCCLATRKT